MKKIKRIPAAVFVPLGGWGMSFVNKYAKMAVYDMWTMITKRGKYNLIQVANPQKLTSHKSGDILEIWKTYETWHIYYEEEHQPLNAYMCTQRGFFNINLYSWTILKALPSENPLLCLTLNSIYNELGSKSEAIASDQDKHKLEKLQIVCLLNLFLKDIYSIITFMGFRKSEIPQVFKEIISELKEQEGKTIELSDLKALFNIRDNKQQWLDAKLFLEKYTVLFYDKDALHYRSLPPSNDENIDITAKLGMVFRYKVNDFMHLSITDQGQKGKILRESVLVSGQWACVFKMEYYMENLHG